MKKRTFLTFGVLFFLAVLVWRGNRSSAQSGGSFDRLTDADRQELAKRFEKEIWPLFTRNGKDGCVGCHKGPIVSALHMTGDIKKDFPMLIREGYFIPNDKGSMLERIILKDPKYGMPPGKLPRWTNPEIDLLRDFVLALDKKQKR